VVFREQLHLRHGPQQVRSSEHLVYGSGYRHRHRPADEPVLNVYAKYQWQNYGAANENEWDGYRFKVKYFVPITELWGGNLSYIGFTNFDWGSDLGDNDFRDLNGQARTSNSIASSHILALNYDHWHYSVVARYWHNGGQWNDDASLNFGDGDFSVRSTGWGGYLVVGYNF
jgi:nucleoside-specific channel-forming protein